MKSIRTVLGSLAIAAALALPSAPASAQAVSDAQLQLARQAVIAARADENFNTALPDVTFQVMSIMIQERPELYQSVSQVVMQAALDIIARRTQLRDDIARIWAQTFTADELNQITAFYSTSAGQKLAGEVGAQLYQDTLQVVQNWSNDLGEEMLDRALELFRLRGVDF